MSASQRCTPKTSSRLATLPVYSSSTCHNSLYNKRCVSLLCSVKPITHQLNVLSYYPLHLPSSLFHHILIFHAICPIYSRYPIRPLHSLRFLYLLCDVHTMHILPFLLLFYTLYPYHAVLANYILSMLSMPYVLSSYYTSSLCYIMCMVCRSDSTTGNGTASSL